MSRDFIMHEFKAEGFDHREPGAKNIRRIPKNPVGIHERWTGDPMLYSLSWPSDGP